MEYHYLAVLKLKSQAKQSYPLVALASPGWDSVNVTQFQIRGAQTLEVLVAFL
jgi:hypothetical protein